MLGWANRFNIFLFLDHNHYPQPATYGFEWVLAVAGEHGFIQSIDQTKNLQHPGWLFGHLSYELKEDLHGLFAYKTNRVGFPRIFFFSPSIIIFFKNDELQVEAEDPDLIFDAINSFDSFSLPSSAVQFTARLSREEYINKIQKLQQHIQRGDCYEINFCQEFYAEGIIDPVKVFLDLSKISPNPFAAFYKLNEQFLICASPERFLRKHQNRLITQPIKGTAPRDLKDAGTDEKLKKELRESAKEQSENVMIVDLMRNDLSMVCKPSTVIVDELFGIYSFPQVHQMISTVSGELKEGVDLYSILKSTFPMGSMTGAPKRRVMELVDEFEDQQRGIFSGSVGYIDPEGNFDFNVVIRSIMYNARDNYISYQVGSGITFYSDPEKEWEECILKAEAIKKVLNISDQHL